MTSTEARTLMAKIESAITFDRLMIANDYSEDTCKWADDYKSELFDYIKSLIK